MAEEVWRITGFNRHPSVIQSLRDEVLPIVATEVPLQIATVPCSTGAEALAIAIELEKERCDYSIEGFDVDERAIAAATDGRYFINSTSGQITGDPHSDHEYHWSNLASSDKAKFLRESGSNGSTMVHANARIATKLRFSLLGVQDIPRDSYDVVFCLNFLRYLTDSRFSPDLPSLEIVSKRLFCSNKSLGALLIDPTSDKVGQIRQSLTAQGYTRLREGTYLKS
ncbi:MAG: hypothetical protein OXR66_06335 [Candidatus Woesearchaeota archaeon]|nr:hypothetical protein [Candidatus Woesearchaeota archaeon]